MSNKRNSYAALLSGLIDKANEELICKQLDKINEDSEFRQFIYTVLYKLTNGLETINLLLHNLENKPQYADTIFISLRALLADMITIDYMLLQAEFKEENLEKELDKVKFDHVSFSINRLKLYQILYESSNKEITSKKKEIINSYPKYFDNNGEIKKGFKKLASIGNMVEKIKKNSTPSIFQRNAILAFECYDLYSKYEHLGQYSSKLVFRSFEKGGIERIRLEIKSCISLLLNFKYALLTEFYTDNQIEETEYYKLYQQIKTDNFNI